jgi:hypothetical protein
MERRLFNCPSSVVSSYRRWLEMENESKFISGIRFESSLARKQTSIVSREVKKVIISFRILVVG